MWGFLQAYIIAKAVGALHQSGRSIWSGIKILLYLEGMGGPNDDQSSPIMVLQSKNNAKTHDSEHDKLAHEGLGATAVDMNAPEVKLHHRQELLLRTNVIV